MPCLSPLCKCNDGDDAINKAPAHDGWGAFIRSRARHFQHLFCSVCRIHPPKHPGGVCDDCDRELGASG